MENLFGDLCSGEKFAHDEEMYAAFGNSEHQPTIITKKQRLRKDPTPLESDDLDSESEADDSRQRDTFRSTLQSYRTAPTKESDNWDEGLETTTTPVIHTEVDLCEGEDEEDEDEDDTFTQISLSTTALASQETCNETREQQQQAGRIQHRKQLYKAVKRMVDHGHGVNLDLISVSGGHGDKELEL